VALQHRIGASRGIGGPLTQAELTLAANGVDFFDVQIIGGVTVPTSITPNGLTPYPGNPYTNGAAGATVAQAGMPGTLGAATWSFSPATTSPRPWTPADAPTGRASPCPTGPARRSTRTG
jgi:hypothetical protein